jgi:hypothetical protein
MASLTEDYGIMLLRYFSKLIWKTKKPVKFIDVHAELCKRTLDKVRIDSDPDLLSSFRVIPERVVQPKLPFINLNLNVMDPTKFQELQNLELHQQLTIDDNIRVMRVPNGFIYAGGWLEGTIFVPYEVSNHPGQLTQQSTQGKGEKQYAGRT